MMYVYVNPMLLIPPRVSLHSPTAVDVAEFAVVVAAVAVGVVLLWVLLLLLLSFCFVVPLCCV